MAEPLVIQKMDLCGLAQGKPYDLTGLCRLMIASWISLNHGVKCGGCEIPMSLPVGAVTSGHHETALKHMQILHAFASADRDLQGLIIPHGIMPVHVSKLLPLLGWYTGMLKSFQLEFTKAQFTVISNLSELHKAHVLHH